MNTSLKDKIFVVTGSTSGIGLAVAQGLALRGASVIGVGRSPERCEQAATQLRNSHPESGLISFLVSDLSIQARVRGLAVEICRTLESWRAPALHGLINNAGTVPFWQTMTPEGFDTQWAVNHLAAFLLTIQVLPLLKTAPMARVVTVSSTSHYNTRLNWDDIQLLRHYSPLRAYNQTKLANVLFTTELNRRLGNNSSVRAFAADPGLVKTDIGLKSNSVMARWVWSLRRRGGISTDESAKGILFLPTEPTIQSSKDFYWKHSKPRAPSTYALNSQVAGQLWELSAQMCGLESTRTL